MTRDDLARFVDGSTFPNLSTPWSAGEYSYASNGHIIIRISRLSDVDEKDTAPKGVDKMFPAVAPAEWFDVTAMDLPEIETVDCRECNGDIPVHDCPDCACTCEYCNGTGKIENPKPFKVGVASFQPKYLQLLKTLPGCSLGPTREDYAAHFKFDGGDGLLMPVRV